MSSLPQVPAALDLSYLQEEAIRLRRQKWKPDMVDDLATEIYLILSGAASPSSGPVTVDPGTGTTPSPQTPGVTISLPPLPPFDPLLPDPLPDPAVTDDTNTDPQNPNESPTNRRKKTISQTRYFRAVIPGQVTGGSGNSYQMTLYPNGYQAPDPDTGQGALTVNVTGVTQLQIVSTETIPAGTWAFVFCVYKYKVTLTQILESGGGTQGNRVVSQSTKITVLSKTYQMQVPVWLG